MRPVEPQLVEGNDALDVARDLARTRSQDQGAPRPTSLDDPTPWPGLTAGEDAWARAYAVTASSREAQAAAGWDPALHKQSARKMLADDEIRIAVGVYSRMVARRTGVRREAVLSQLARIGFADVCDLYDPETGEVLPPHRLPVRVRAAIAGVSTTVAPDGSITHAYTLAPRVKALELLARVSGMTAEASRGLRVRLTKDPGKGEGVDIKLVRGGD